MHLSTRALASLASIVTLLPVEILATLNPGNGTLGTFSWQSTRYIFAFGDSYSASNFDVAKGVLGPDNGKTTSNGPNWIQHLSRTLNESDVLLRNFAANGASIDNDLVAITDHETGVAQQVLKFERYLSPPPKILPWESTNTLFSVWVGINDCDLTYERKSQGAWHRREFKVWTSLQEKLYSLGARHFLFMTVPPTYASPLYRGRGDLKIAIEDYNYQLRQNAIAFQNDHTDAVVLFFDAFTTFGEILDNSWQEGFKNTSHSCPKYRNGTPSLTTLYPECVNPVNEYFWTDELHPSSRVHKLLASQVKEFLDAPTWLPHSNSLEEAISSDLSAQGQS